MDREKSTPVPIFNYRKRPRQAVIADPQDGHSISNKYQGLMPVGGFENKSRNNSQGFQRFSALQNGQISERGDQPTHPFHQRNHGNQQGNGQNPITQSNTGASFSTNRNSFSGVNQMGDSSRSMKQQTKGNNSVSHQHQGVPYLKGGYASQNKTSYVDQSKVNQPRRLPSATITSANQRICSTSSGLQYGQEQGNNRNQQQNFQPAHTPTVKTYHGLQNNQQNYRNYKQNTQQSYGYAKNTQQSYGSAQNTQQSYGSTKNTQQSYGSSKNTQQSYGSSKITQQSYGSAQNTQQSYGSAQNSQQSYGSAQQQGYQQNSKINQQNKPFNKVAMPSMFQQESGTSPSTGGIPIDKSPARGVVYPGESKVFSNGSQTRGSFQKEKQQNKKPSEKKIDPSLHVMTLHASSVPHWAKYRDNINMIFEVFGIIDSTVIRDATDTYKEFILRDEQHHLKCVFYEIDRELQKLIRGHWQRCVGTYDIKNGCFKCVSVRAASMEEKNHGQQLAKSTNELLKQITRHLPEQ
ncbi:uncharacterized protein LOC134706155 [Mytilus trossulus]|uniref:uncharacterized protein LOC134706155 n=1 Tax=Mytilus trossulus TaxID=6551 RepID=UPI003007659B